MHGFRNVVEEALRSRPLLLERLLPLLELDLQMLVGELQCPCLSLLFLEGGFSQQQGMLGLLHSVVIRLPSFVFAVILGVAAVRRLGSLLLRARRRTLLSWVLPDLIVSY